MHFEIVKTFLTLVADDDEEGGASDNLRCHSAPPACRFADRKVSMSRKQSERQKKKAARARKSKLAKAADAADYALLTEHAAKAEEEERLFNEEGTQQYQQNVATAARRDELRKRVQAKRCAENRSPETRLHFHGPNDPRPPGKIFVVIDNYGEIGFAHDPNFSTTELQRLLINLNHKKWNDGYVVTTLEGQFVPIGTTLGAQGVMPGARLRLTRSAELDPCVQS